MVYLFWSIEEFRRHMMDMETAWDVERREALDRLQRIFTVAKNTRVHFLDRSMERDRWLLACSLGALCATLCLQ